MTTAERWILGDPDRPYHPEPPQAKAHQAHDAEELLYGGAAGGGKTHYLIAEAISMALQIPGSATIIFRRTFPDLKRTIIRRMLGMIPPRVARYNQSDHVWTFPNGSTIELGYLRYETDVLQYQGAEYQLAIFDELTQFTEYQFDYIATRCRAGGAVWEAMKAAGINPRIRATTNPGGPGHHWVRARFVDPAPWGTLFRPEPTEESPDPRLRMFVPARLSDNPHMNPGYARQLDAIPDPDLRRALKDGDWDILQGVRFKQWRRAVHVVEAGELDLPLVGYPRVLAIDWGMQAPFAALWMCLLPGGTVYVYREAYEVGLTTEEQTALLLSMEDEGERTDTRPLPLIMDPSMWARNPHTKLGPVLDKDRPVPGSVASVYWGAFGGDVHKANNARIDGWALIDSLLRVGPGGLPRLLVSSQCPNLIRTLPALPRSTRNVEDVDCFVAGTLIGTPTGPRAVETLGVGDLVSTPMGPQRVIKAEPEPAVPVARVDLSDGRSLVGTADHQVVTRRGLVELRRLTRTDELITDTDVEEYGVWTPATRSFTAASHTAVKLGARTTSRPPGGSSVTAGPRFTETSGGTPTGGISPRVSTSTTWTTTLRTTLRRTWLSFRQATTPSTTTGTGKASATPSGASPTPARPSSGGTSRRPAPRWQRETERARIVETLSSQPTGPRSIAQASVSTADAPARTSGTAPSAGPSSAGRSTAGTSRRLAPTNVDGSYDVATVYALTVDGCALYYANGVLVTNTTAEDHAPDALRYGVMSLSGGGHRRVTDNTPTRGVEGITTGLATAEF